MTKIKTFGACIEKGDLCNADPQTVTIDLEKIVNVPISQDDLVWLEVSDSSLIYDVCALVETDDEWIVQSRALIKAYDKESGRYAHTVSGIGQGPGEILGVQHFWADGDTLHILDFSSGCVFDFLANGEYLGKKFDFRNIEAEGYISPTYMVDKPDGSGYIAVNCYKGRKDNPGLQYSLYDDRGRFLKNIEGRYLRDGGFTPDRMFTDREQERVLAWEQLRDTLFRVDDAGVTPLYVWDFGKYSFPVESQSKDELYLRVEDFGKNDSSIPYASFIKYYQTGGGYLYFSFMTADNEGKAKSFLAKVDEENLEVKVYHFESADARLQQAPFFKIEKDHIIISVNDKESVEANPALLEVPLDRL